MSLRLPAPQDDIAQFQQPASPEIVRMYGGDPAQLPAPNQERSRKWLEWLTAHPFARIIDVGGAPVGHVRLHSLNKVDRKAKLAIGLFEEIKLG